MQRSLCTLLFATLVATGTACGSDGGGAPTDTGGQSDTGPDGTGDAGDGGPDGVADVPPGQARWERPSGYASLVFRVDDSANRTYDDAQMEWNGSFAYDATTNIVLFASSWLPEQGPFPPLYDDGPYDSGGHEAAGSTAGDGLFEVEVFYLAEADTTFEYGLINEDDRWIWRGSNGTIDVSAGETGTVVAPGMAFPPFGAIDMRVTLDTSALHSEFSTIDPASDSVWLKGSMISWAPVQLLDNGARGDETAGDGLFTFTLSQSLGPHDGLLALGQEAQFVFVFFDARGSEYKLAGNALTNGVAAYSNWSGSWEEEELLLRSESRGQALNTAILIGPDDVQSEDPILRFVDPDRGPTTGGTPVELTGESFQVDAVVTFGGVEASCVVQSDEIITCTTPERASPGTVSVTVTNGDAGSDTHQLGYTYLDVASAPRIDSVAPAEGSELGGTLVTLGGANFAEGATVSLGDSPASGVSVSGGVEAAVTTPAGVPGPVDVTLRNPDGQIATLPGGFSYLQEGIDWAAIQWPTTTVTAGTGETLPALSGAVYEPGITDAEGQGAGLTAEIVIGPSGADPTLDFTDWTAYSAAYIGDIGNNDEYAQSGDISLVDEGSYDWAVRFSLDGGTTWYWADQDGDNDTYDPEASGSIVVTSGLRVGAIEPDVISILGSAELVVTGANFTASMTVETRRFGSDGAFASVPVSFESSTEVTLGFPPPTEARSPGAWDLRFTDGADVVTLENAYLAGYLWTAPVDGSLADWDPAFLHAQNTLATNWTESELHTLYASFDDDGLYLGLAADLERGGDSDPGNVVIVYVDTDFGTASGFIDMASIADEDTDVPESWWRLDRALTSQVNASGVSGFGADVAFGSFELAPTAVNYQNRQTGWRLLRAGDNAWTTIDSACDGGICVAGSAGDEESAGVIETFVPWGVLYGDSGLPLGGSRIALFARIVNRTGDFTSNQSLPEEPEDEDDWNVTDVVVLDVR